MRIGILADIHGNLEALRSVVDDMAGHDVQEVICLGDNVGYGPDPEAVVQHLVKNTFRSVLGNHELALFDQRARNWLNFQAVENCLESKKLMSQPSLDYLYNLPRNIQSVGGFFVHGFPPQSVFLYLNQQEPVRIGKLFEKLPEDIFFVGHTHKLEVVAGGREQGEIDRWVPDSGKVPLETGKKYIFGCGSVGQPRERDRRAVYLVWDDEAREVEVIRVAYDYRLTREKIRDRGFPEIYGLRLGPAEERR